MFFQEHILFSFILMVIEMLFIFLAINVKWNVLRIIIFLFFIPSIILWLLLRGLIVLSWILLLLLLVLTIIAIKLTVR